MSVTYNHIIKFDTTFSKEYTKEQYFFILQMPYYTQHIYLDLVRLSIERFFALCPNEQCYALWASCLFYLNTEILNVTLSLLLCRKLE